MNTSFFKKNYTYINNSSINDCSLPQVEVNYSSVKSLDTVKFMYKLNRRQFYSLCLLYTSSIVQVYKLCVHKSFTILFVIYFGKISANFNRQVLNYRIL